MSCLTRGILAIAIMAAAAATGRADDQLAPPSEPVPVEPAPVEPSPTASGDTADDSPASPPPVPVAGVGGPSTEPPASPPPAAAKPAPPPEPAADGTTSVVVPSSPDPAPPPAGELVPAVPNQPAGPPASLPPSPPQPAPPQAFQPLPPAVAPADLPQPPPQSEAALTLAEMLEPLAAAPGRQVAPLEVMLYARPLQLLEALGRSGDRSRRLWIVQAYWKVSAGYASVRNATEALEQLELVAPGADPHDRATLDVATAAARADLAEAHARLTAAQQELVDLARLPATEPLPWPVDRPLADPYQTHFEAIFANRIATGRVRAIVRGLPARHEALAARAAAVAAAEKAMAMAEADHAKGNRPIEAVIAAHLAVTGQQERFLEAVNAYNLEIAEYAMAVAELSLPDDQFVSMLIGTPIQWRPPAPVAPVAAGLSEPSRPAAIPSAASLPDLAPAVVPAE
jgi:hypothetical protein